MKCEKCGQEIKGIKIVSRYDPEKILFQSSKETMKEAIERAVSKGANLRSADLRCANLRCATLEGATLERADLRCANLNGADLRSGNTIMCTINFRSLEYAQAKQFIEGLK